MKKIALLLFSFFLLIGTTACTSKKEKLEKYSFTSTSLGFDTVIMFTAYAESEEQYKQYEKIVIDSFKYYDQLFDKYHSYDKVANIKTINDQAGKEPVKVEEPVMELLLLARSMDEISNHQFSVTLGSVLNVWHDAREYSTKHPDQAYVPSKEELENANKNTGWQFVELNENKQTVQITNKDTQLDVGGVAKGYAVEQVAQKLEKAGLKHGLINGGGNVRLIGPKPNDEPWNVGLQIPNDQAMTTDSLISIQINDSSSFVTSGDYQRYYMVDGQRMHHVIDPETLMPANHCRSVTVITADSGLADLLSTTLFTMSYQDGTALLHALQENLDMQVEAIWVYDDEIGRAHV